MTMLKRRLTRPILTHPLLAIAALASLSACASAQAPDRIVNAKTPTEHYQAKAVASQQEVRLAVHAQGLSGTQADALAQFAQDWADADGGTITLRAPTGGPDAGAAFRTVEGARSFLIDQGVPSDRLIVAGYDAKGAPGGVLHITYEAYSALVPACGKTWTNIARSMSNDVQPNFGCAVTANMAAQIANPADLARPQHSTPADAARRAVVLDKYRKGQITASEKDDQAKGVVSDAIK
jgi:pilus assembly protein CpaD